jgi:hypothetical protein
VAQGNDARIIQSAKIIPILTRNKWYQLWNIAKISHNIPVVSALLSYWYDVTPLLALIQISQYYENSPTITFKALYTTITQYKQSIEWYELDNRYYFYLKTSNYTDYCYLTDLQGNLPLSLPVSDTTPPWTLMGTVIVS